jgi:hypothetical protein
MEDKWFERILIVAGVIGLFALLYATSVYAAGTVCQIGNGCTGTSTAPSYGKVLIGDAGGHYELTATSSLGFPTGGSGTVTSVGFSSPNSTLTIGSSPITTSGTITGDLALATSNQWTASTTFTKVVNLANASSSLNTFGTVWLPSITSALHLGDSAGKITAYTGTSCSNQFVRSLNGAGVATCNSVSLTSDITGTLGITNGGTNAASFGTSNGIVAYNGTSLVNYSGYTLTSSLLTAGNASTTNFSVNGNEVSGQRYPVWGYATSTAWTGTTTQYLIATFTGNMAGVYCTTASSTRDTTGTYTVDAQFYVGATPVTPMVVASTTDGYTTFTANASFTKGQLIGVDYGTPVNSPQTVQCSPIGSGY